MATSPTPASHSHSSEKPRQDPGQPRGTKSLSGSRADSGTRSCLRQVAEFLPSQADHPPMLPTLLTASRPYPNDLPESEPPRSLPGPEDPARGHVAHAPSRLATSPRSKRHFVIPGHAPISPASVPDLGSNLALTTLPLRRSPHQLCALATHLLSLLRACTLTCPTSALRLLHHVCYARQSNKARPHVRGTSLRSNYVRSLLPFSRHLPCPSLLRCLPFQLWPLFHASASLRLWAQFVSHTSDHPVTTILPTLPPSLGPTSLLRLKYADPPANSNIFFYTLGTTPRPSRKGLGQLVRVTPLRYAWVTPLPLSLVPALLTGGAVPAVANPFLSLGTGKTRLVRVTSLPAFHTSPFWPVLAVLLGHVPQSYVPHWPRASGARALAHLKFWPRLRFPGRPLLVPLWSRVCRQLHALCAPFRWETWFRETTEELEGPTGLWRELSRSWNQMSAAFIEWNEPADLWSSLKKWLSPCISQL